MPKMPLLSLLTLAALLGLSAPAIAQETKLKAATAAEEFRGLWALEGSQCSGDQMQAIQIEAAHILLYDPAETPQSFSVSGKDGFSVTDVRAVSANIVRVTGHADSEQVFNVKIENGEKLSFSFWLESEDRAVLYFLEDGPSMDLHKCPLN